MRFPRGARGNVRCYAAVGSAVVGRGCARADVRDLSAILVGFGGIQLGLGRENHISRSKEMPILIGDLMLVDLQANGIVELGISSRP